MRRTAGVFVVVLVLVVLGACGGWSSQETDDEAAGTSTTEAPDPTTTTEPEADEIEALSSFDMSATEYVDTMSIVAPTSLSDFDAGGGIPVDEEEPGVFGGEVAEGVDFYVMAPALDEPVRGSVVVVDLGQTDNRTPAQFVALASVLDATSDTAGIFQQTVLPELSNIDEDVQRFNLGAVTIEMRLYAPDKLIFIIIGAGETAPEVLEELV